TCALPISTGNAGRPGESVRLRPTGLLYHIGNGAHADGKEGQREPETESLGRHVVACLAGGAEPFEVELGALQAVSGLRLGLPEEAVQGRSEVVGHSAALLAGGMVVLGGVRV